VTSCPPLSLLNCEPNYLKVAKLTSEAEARRREAWAGALGNVVFNESEMYYSNCATNAHDDVP
jgi:hypothetical protein